MTEQLAKAMNDVGQMRELLADCPQEIKDYVSELEQQNIQFYDRLHSADAQLQQYAGEVYRLRGERQILTMLVNELTGMLEHHAPATVANEAESKRESIARYIAEADENAEATAKAVQEDVNAEG